MMADKEWALSSRASPFAGLCPRKDVGFDCNLTKAIRQLSVLRYGKLITLARKPGCRRTARGLHSRLERLAALAWPRVAWGSQEI